MFDDDDDFGGRGLMGPMFILQALGPMVMMMALIGLMFPLLLYVVARWRDHRAPTADPQLGLKFALHFFRIQGYQLVLAGLFMLVYSVLAKKLPSEARELIWRPALGLVVPAGLVFGLMTTFLGKTNNDVSPAVGRLFNGYNLMVTGIIGFVALIMGFQLLFQKGPSGDLGRVVWSAILVYTTAAAVQGALFGRAVLDAPPPASLEPPAPPATAEVPGPMQRPLA